MQLEFEVKNQTVKLLGDYELVKGSKNYLVAHFTFSEDWQDVSKKMIYFTKNSPDKEIFVGTTADGGTKIGYTLDSNDSVLVPPEFIQKSGFIVNLTGLNSDKQEVITTNPATVYVTDNGLLTDETEGKTLPEYLEEKLVAINKAVIDSEEQAEAAANSAGKAEAAKTAAQKAQQAAETAKDTAGDEAQNAANSAELAQKWAESSTSPDGEPDSKSAKTWAEEASASAGAASTSKTQAATSASNAADSASAAAGSATSASGSASTATQKAQEAANSANTASTAASTATSKASEAATSASTATSKAQAASESAQDAADSAGEAADSASAAESSKTAAAQSANAAAQSASEAGNAATEAVGNPVTSVTKDGNNIKVQKKDGTSNEIPLPTVPGVASQSEAEAGTENTKIMTALRTKQATAALVASVTESNGTVTVKKKSGSANTFIIIKTINGKEPTNGNFDIKGIPLDTNGTISPWQHNGIFRGKNLGSSVTSAQWAAIQAGTFDDLYIGDYWTINGIEWVIVAFDYYYNTGDTACTTHHVVVIPRTNLYNAQMNTENVTTGAYVGSKMYTENLNQAKTTIQNAFGASHLLSIRQHFQNATTNGYESGGTWYDATVWLMSEANVYGGNVFKSVINGTGWPNLYSIDNRQYPYFRFALPNEKRTWYWLRDVASSSAFARVSSFGNSDAGNASNSGGVRPAFCIKAS